MAALSFLRKNHVIAALLFLSIAIQIQITLFESETYNGLRVNLADMALPFLALIFLVSAFKKPNFLPQFHINHVYWWLAGLGLIIFTAFLHGYYRYDVLSLWAMVNKTFGWVVLSFYFIIGGWLASRINEDQLRLFLKFIFCFFLIVSCLQFIRSLAYYFDVKILEMFPHHPASAYMHNKNAYIFLFMSLLAFSIFFYGSQLKKTITYIFCFLVPIAFILTMARAAFIVFPFILILLIIFNKRLKKEDWLKCLLAFLIGVVFIIGLSYFLNTSLHIQRKTHYHIITKLKDMPDHTIETMSETINYRGDSNRLKVMGTAFDMIKENPMMGYGLNAIYHEQIAQWGQFMNIIDSTPLWLWAETGLIGLLAFLAFYIMCLKTLYRNGMNKENSETARSLNKSVFIMLLIFAGMSVFHELLYTRFMWLFMGMALAYPLKEKFKKSDQRQT